MAGQQKVSTLARHRSLAFLAKPSVEICAFELIRGFNEVFALYWKSQDLDLLNSSNIYVEQTYKEFGCFTVNRDLFGVLEFINREHR